MLSLLNHLPTLCDGVTRREWMRIGGAGLGGVEVREGGDGERALRDRSR